jgi:hypothetical protein
MSAVADRRRYDRRTGVAFLSLIAATNVVPWMELLLGETAAAEPLAPSEIRVTLGTCVLALLALLAAWFAGRRGTIPESPRIRQPRTAGLWFTVAAAAANLILAAAVRLVGVRPFPGVAELPIFAAIWYLVILPLEIVGGFALGRAGRMPGRRHSTEPSRL